jgi:hypothetical protein
MDIEAYGGFYLWHMHFGPGTFKSILIFRTNLNQADKSKEEGRGWTLKYLPVFLLVQVSMKCEVSENHRIQNHSPPINN